MLLPLLMQAGMFTPAADPPPPAEEPGTGSAMGSYGLHKSTSVRNSMLFNTHNTLLRK